MSNSALTQVALPAELMRGVKFAADFRDKASMLCDDWTLFNDPVVDEGIELDGVNQYAKCGIAGIFGGDVITINVEFYPLKSNISGGYQYVYCDAGDKHRFFVYAAGNARIYSGGTLVLIISEPTMSAAWRVGERNLYTFSQSSTGCDAWLNGQLLGTSVGHPTLTNATTMCLGAFATGVNTCGGKYIGFDIGRYVATLQEHLDRYNQTTWDWENKLAVNLQMRTRDLDMDNVQTLDSSKRENHATLGDGSTPATYPTQSKGYMIFDGVDDYLSGIANPTGSFTVMGLKDIGTGWEFFSHNDLTEWTPIFTSGSFSGRLAGLIFAPSVLSTVQEYDAEIGLLAKIGSQS